VFSELSTPLTTEHFTAHPRGSIYGVPATPERYRKSWLKPDTPLKNLYLTGADAGCLGIMGALMGGVSAAARIIGPMGLFSIMAAAAQNKAKSASAMRAAPQTTS
jgi:phytoene dehydrogenase-like protein